MKRNPIFLIAGIALFIAIADMPYGYYQLLRFFVCAVGGYGAYLSYQNRKIGWVWTSGIIALLFNPFMKFYLAKETWKFLDLIAAVVFCIYFVVQNKERQKTQCLLNKDTL